MQALKYLSRLGVMLLRMMFAPRLMKCQGPGEWEEARSHEWAHLKML